MVATPFLDYENILKILNSVEVRRLESRNPSIGDKFVLVDDYRVTRETLRGKNSFSFYNHTDSRTLSGIKNTFQQQWDRSKTIVI